MQHHSRIYSLISLLLAAFAGLFISCSQNLPEVENTDYSVIFEYQNEKELPSARLSVFAASVSDVRRYQTIKITSLETGYYWESQGLTMLEADSKQWTGCTNLLAPENEKLPTGTYEITFINADEKECTLTLDIKYDIDFYDVLLPSLTDVMTQKRGIEKIAVFDKEHILIYFGDRTEEFKTTRDIWNRWREAVSYQIIWYTKDGSVICLTPEKPVSPEQAENDEL